MLKRNTLIMTSLCLILSSTPALAVSNTTEQTTTSSISFNENLETSTLESYDSNEDNNNMVSADVAWQNIRSNSQNNTSQEAFGRSIPKSNKFLTSSVDASGVTHNYYLLTLKDKYSSTSNNYLTRLDTCLIYDDNYVTSNQYNNGYYGTWFPTNSLSMDKGVMSADLGFKKYSFEEFGRYRRLHLFDFYTQKDYTVEYYDFKTTHPYKVFYNLVDNSRIVYGQACWYDDGSGSSFLTRIDRTTGQKITNKNIVFNYSSEIEKGTMINDNEFQFYTSKNGGYLYKINLDNLEIIDKQAVTKNSDGTYTNR